VKGSVEKLLVKVSVRARGLRAKVLCSSRGLTSVGW